MKNITTPRTLADCQFTVGYSQAERPTKAHPAEWVMLGIVVLCIVVPLAWHFSEVLR